MKVAVHFTTEMPAQSYAFKWVEELEKREIEVLKINLREKESLNKLAKVDGVMWHWYHLPDDKQAAPPILNTIENVLSIPVFPNFNTRWHFDDKVAQAYIFEAIGASAVKNWVFWDLPAALNFLKDAKYPLVAKLAVGAGSTNVFKLQDQQEAEQFAQLMFTTGKYPYTEYEYKVEKSSNLKTKLKNMLGKSSQEELPWYFLLQKNYLYLQEFLPNNGYDIRVTVIGDRAFTFVRHNRDNDFRASGSGKIDYDPDKMPQEAIQIAFDISQKCGFQSMAYDFLRDENGNVLVNEMSYAYVSSAVYDCPGHWDSKMKFIEGNVWPEAAHVEDFINQIKAK